MYPYGETFNSHQALEARLSALIQQSKPWSASTDTAFSKIKNIFECNAKYFDCYNIALLEQANNRLKREYTFPAAQLLVDKTNLFIRTKREMVSFGQEVSRTVQDNLNFLHRLNPSALTTPSTSTSSTSSETSGTSGDDTAFFDNLDPFTIHENITIMRSLETFQDENTPSTKVDSVTIRENTDLLISLAPFSSTTPNEESSIKATSLINQEAVIDELNPESIQKSFAFLDQFPIKEKKTS